MAKHRHYDLIVQWASDPEAYNVQYRWSSDGDWRPCDAPMWDTVEYRLIPNRTMMHLNGMEFPAPETEAPEDGTICYLPCVSPNGADPFFWTSTNRHVNKELKAGLIHLTKEAAEAHARAMLNAKEVE